MNTQNWIRQHRRSTYMPRKRSLIEEVYPVERNRESTDSGSRTGKRLSWLEKVRRRSVAASTKGRIVRESQFSPDYRGVYCVRFLPNGERFVVSYGSGAIQLWQPEGDDSPTTIKGSPEHGFPIMCLRFLPSKFTEQFFAAGADGNILFCSLKPGDYKVYAKEPGNEINTLDVNLEGNTLITGGKDATLRLYDITTGKLKGKLGRKLEDRTEESFQKFHKMRIFAIKFHHSMSDIFLTGGWDDCVKIWDIRVKNGRIRDIPGPHICGEALDVKNEVVLTGSWVVQKSLQTWDLGTGKLMETITPFNRPFTVDGEFLYCAQFFGGDPLGEVVVSGGSGVGKVEITNINEKKVVRSFKVQKSVHSIDTTDYYVAYGGMESIIRVATT